MTKTEARYKVRLLIPDDSGITSDLIDSFLLDGAQEIAKIGAGPYRHTITVDTTVGQRWVSVEVDDDVFDMLWPIYVLYDGRRLHPTGSFEALEEWRDRHGIELVGTPQQWAVDDKGNPRAVWFDRTPEEIKTVSIHYAREIAAWEDLPSRWHIHAVNYARAEVAAVLDKSQLAEYYGAKYEAFSRRLARKLAKSHGEVGRIVGRSYWLTEGI